MKTNTVRHYVASLYLSANSDSYRLIFEIALHIPYLHDVTIYIQASPHSLFHSVYGAPHDNHNNCIADRPMETFSCVHKMLTFSYYDSTMVLY